LKIAVFFAFLRRRERVLNKNTKIFKAKRKNFFAFFRLLLLT